MALHQIFLGFFIAIGVPLGTVGIAVPPSDPAVDFDANPANVNENVGSVTITLVAGSAVSQDVTVDVTAMMTTDQAVPGFDYSGSGTYTATILNGATTGTFDLTILDDSFMEPAEVVMLSIDSVSAGGTAGTTTQTVSFTILVDGSDTDLVRLDFRRDSYEVNEGDGFITLEVDFTDLSGQPTALNEAFTFTPTTPCVITTDTASVGTDYQDPTATSVTLPLDLTSTSFTFTVAIIDDDVNENTESVSIGMMADSSLTNTLLGNFISETLVRIRDNDVDNLICVSTMPEVSPFRSVDFVFYAFTSFAGDASSIAWANRRLSPSLSTTALVGSNGKALIVSEPRKGKHRRFGRYTFTATGDSGASLACNTFVRPKNNVFNQPSSFDHKFTKVLYPTVEGSTDISPPITISVQYKTPRRRNKIIWRKNGVLLPRETRAAITLDSTTDAGFYIVSRFVRRRREFAMFELIASDCPENSYMNTTCMSCPTCYNGGVCNHDGRCVCPPCFEGVNCEHVVDDVDGFGQATRFSCLTDLNVTSLCRGVLFTFEGLYGSSCGCGWSGQDCSTACTTDTFGADCAQTCHCATPSACDIMTGVCTDGNGCDTGFSGENCQIPDVAP